MGKLKTKAFDKILWYPLNENGFTMIELLIVIAMSGIIVTLIINNLTQSSSESVKQDQVLEIQQNARAALNLITREIKKAGFDSDGKFNTMVTEAGCGLNASTAYTPGPFSFTYLADNDDKDNDSDGNVDEKGELASLAIQLYDSSIDSGNTMDEIHLGSGLQPVAENIANEELDIPIFEYFDKDGVSLGNSVSDSDMNKIRAVYVKIIARPDESERNMSNGSQGYRTLETMVKCRNLGI
ncbi:MAG: prepilin-type N-terminal cleavage/methylation domain-containing protein [Thermodesulfobacteriota bacterium]|nr:prepilin-type N-terminal cleavage/methylation domain-containing protein [Thermodesulfobacteriota bacterium]